MGIVKKTDSGTVTCISGTWPKVGSIRKKYIIWQSHLGKWHVARGGHRTVIKNNAFLTESRSDTARGQRLAAFRKNQIFWSSHVVKWQVAKGGHRLKKKNKWSQN